MSKPPRSPRIAFFRWGHVEVENQGTFSDVKLFPGGARAWDWRETGTRHDPGIQPADVEELLEHGATVVVLSRGVDLRLGVCPETLRALADKDVAVHWLPTEEAVEVYNRLCETEAVGGLFHSTC
ncbi:MAG: hypothetical protein HQ581_17035 [Planctomycetes bacterium]|nr:hypothetical protein [Planctomycetota bacterium]